MRRLGRVLLASLSLVLLGGCAAGAASPDASSSVAPEPASSGAATACTLELTHIESERAFHYRVRVTGLEPGASTPRIEFRRGTETFTEMSSEDDPEAVIPGTGVFEGGGNLDDPEVPLTGDGDWTATITEPASCAGTTVSFDPLEYRGG